MSTLWSERVQGIADLDYSRSLRFRDECKEDVLRALGLEAPMKVADLGCGPGTLARKIGQWLGADCEVLGIDRDTVFVEHARREAAAAGLSHVHFAVGDVLDLSLQDNAFDVCLSSAVLEHVPHEPFLREQLRVLRAGGSASVLTFLPSRYIKTTAMAEALMKPREQQLWQRLCQGMEPCGVQGVAAYPVDLAKLPAMMEAVGFEQIRIDSLTFPQIVDDARLAAADRLEMVAFEKLQLLEQLQRTLRWSQTPLAEEEAQELEAMIHDRFRKRAEAATAGVHHWDYTIVVAVTVSGSKPY